MNQNKTPHPGQDVVAYLTDFLRVRINDYLVDRGKTVALGPNALRYHAFYAKILYCVVSGKPPKKDGLSDCIIRGNEETTYRIAIEQYRAWKKLGTLSATFSYCERANWILRKLVDQNGIPKTEEFPDLRKEVIAIHEMVKKLCAKEN